MSVAAYHITISRHHVVEESHYFPWRVLCVLFGEQVVRKPNAPYRTLKALQVRECVCEARRLFLRNGSPRKSLGTGTHIQAPKKAVEWRNGEEACGATYRKSRKQV